MITIDATGATSGIDFEEYIRGGFISDATGGGFPVFDNGAAFSGEEMVISYGSASTSKYVLAHGSLEYYFSTHTVWGTINTLEFGTLGSGSYDANGYFTGGNVELRITGLELFNAQPTNPTEEAEIEANGPVHNFAVAYMYGATADQARLDKFADALDSQAQHFKGSAFDDIYTGTEFDDIIEGNDGDDVLAGGGGSDHIDGGDGIDTAVFDGVQSAYVIKKYAGGLVTVSIGEDTSTLRSIEKLRFDDGTVDVADFDEIARVTIDARGSDGIDFNTYFADYFATLQLNGTSSYHGGTEDAPYGYLNGDQVSFKYRALDDASGPFTSVVILEGEEIAYDSIHYPDGGYPHGSISGTIEKLIFGSIVGDEPASGAELYTGYEAELIISGLGIHDDPGAGGSTSDNLVPTLYYAVRSGNADKINEVLSNYAFDFIGSDGDDIFVGGVFDDAIDGGAGNDQLSGGRGDDTISGGLGDDALYGGFGNDTLVGGAGNDVLHGDEGDDVLYGEDGADVLYGGDGADVLDGGAGNDQLYGGAGADVLTGGAGRDVLEGGAGADVLDGGDGNDTLRGGDGADILVGGKGHDVLEGGAGHDHLVGGAGKDVLRGGAGDDVLNGGKARDKLFGGAGADTFVFQTKLDSSAKLSRSDVIRDFSRKDGDLIDLSGLKGKTVLDFIGTSHFTGAGNEVRYAKKEKSTVIKIDLDGDSKVDMAIKLSGKVHLTEGDFVL